MTVGSLIKELKRLLEKEEISDDTLIVFFQVDEGQDLAGKPVFSPKLIDDGAPSKFLVVNLRIPHLSQGD